MKLADLFHLQPAPIYGQYVRRVVFDQTPIDPPPKMSEEELRANRREKDRLYRLKCRIRELTPEEMDDVRCG